MGSVTECTTLVRIMIEEIRLLEQFCREEEKMKEYILDMSWPELQETIQRVNPLSIAVSLIEQERDRCFKKLKTTLNTSGVERFYASISGLQEKERRELVDTYRKLKMMVLMTQGVTRSIESLIETLSGTIRGVMEELFPYRRGKIYSATGAAKDVEMNPVMINRHL